MTYQPQQPPVVAGHTVQPPQGDWTPPKPKSKAVPILIAVIILLVLAAGGLIYALTQRPSDKTPAKTTVVSAAPATFQVSGTLTLAEGQFITTDDIGGCRGQGGFDDLALGAAVTITDASGAVVAVSQLSGMNAGDGMQGTCELAFSVPNIPAGKGFYGVEVSHRGAVKYEEAKLKAGPVELTVG